MIDIDDLLREISPEAPCGNDLQLDAKSDYGTLERAAEGTPERQMGDTIVPAKEPHWVEVRDIALKLFSETRDLRIAALLNGALTRIEGWKGFSDGLMLMQGLLERYWDCVHPQLDPDDDNDPTFRVNTIASLNDTTATLNGLLAAILVEARGIGRFSLRDIEIANGERSAPKDDKTPHPEPQIIAAAFQDADLEQLQDTANAISQSLEMIAAIESILMDRVGPEESPNLAAVISLIKTAQKTLAPYLAERMELAAPADEVTDLDAEGGAETSAEAVKTPARTALKAINSRDDVIRAIDLICAYYTQQEPSSPVPILLKRAKRLVTKDFMDILRDLAPDGVSQLELIKGPEPED